MTRRCWAAVDSSRGSMSRAAEHRQSSWNQRIRQRQRGVHRRQPWQWWMTRMPSRWQAARHSMTLGTAARIVVIGTRRCRLGSTEGRLDCDESSEIAHCDVTGKSRGCPGHLHCAYRARNRGHAIADEPGQDAIRNYATVNRQRLALTPGVCLAARSGTSFAVDHVDEPPTRRVSPAPLLCRGRREVSRRKLRLGRRAQW
jgi:hypothetical protein